MLHMRRRSSIRTSHAEVEHAPGGLPLAQQQPGAAAAAAAAAAQQQQQQRRHYALLFCPNTDTDTGPEAGNKLARTQAREQALALGAALRCQSRRLFLSPWPRAPPRPRQPAPGPGILWPRPQGPPEKLARPRPQESPQKPWNSNTKTESGQRPGERFSEQEVTALLRLWAKLHLAPTISSISETKHATRTWCAA
jgi:hypothetical protein